MFERFHSVEMDGDFEHEGLWINSMGRRMELNRDLGYFGWEKCLRNTC